MKKMLMKKLTQLVAFLCLAIALPAQAAFQMNMPQGATPISHDIFDLHMFAIWVCVGIGVVVYGVMVYTIIRHRKSRGAVAAHFHENIWLEIAWTVVPFILLIILAVPATTVLARMENTKNADITIKVTGYQWKWQYQYFDQGLSFFSNLSTPVEQIYDEAPKNEWYLLEVDRELVLPIHHKIRFLVTSNDVIHAWWVPDLGIKRDAMPGFIHEAWTNIDKPGIYRGQCAELCGVNHGFMPIVVRAVTDDEFKEWVAKEAARESTQATLETSTTEVSSVQSQSIAPKPAKTLTFDALMAEGKKQYGKYCSVCHKMDGLGMPPVFPALKGSSVAVGDSIARHIQLVLTGVPGTAMQAFADQLDDNEMAAIITFERNAWGNNTSDVVQASDVAAVRQGAKEMPVTMVEHKKYTENEEEAK